MVGSNASNLGAYGLDFVVATTQASINSSLLAFFDSNSKTVAYSYFCFLYDSASGGVQDPIDLEALKTLLNNNDIDPFDEDLTKEVYSQSQRIAALTSVGFVAGIKLQVGLPRGVAPTSLPPVIDLESGTNTVLFNMFCSHFQVVENNPGGFGACSWNSWSQQQGSTVAAQARVDLVIADLDKELNSTYFNNNPDMKAHIKSQLVNLSGTAFSLQQLVFDLDNASIQTHPDITGVPAGSNAQLVIQKYFQGIYADHAKTAGLPLLSVTAIVQVDDPSPLQMTAYERRVNFFRDDNGHKIDNPDDAQRQVKTLDYLCQTNNNPLPATVANFAWNWVQPSDIDVESGVVVISQQSFQAFLLDQLMPLIKNNCWAWIDGKPDALYEYLDDGTIIVENIQMSLLNNQTPVEDLASGPGIHYSYKFPLDTYDSSHDLHWICETEYHFHLEFDLSSSGIKLNQSLLHKMGVSNSDNLQVGPFNLLDLTISDIYTLSVDEFGVLNAIKSPSSHTDDKSDILPIRPPGSEDTQFYFLLRYISTTKSKVSGWMIDNLNSLNIDNLKNFIFPGGKVFTYKSVKFSEHGDLECLITYVDPMEVMAAPPPPPPPPPTNSLPTLAPKVINLTSRALPAVPPSLGTAKPASRLTYSSDLMQNYLHGNIFTPTGKFEAVQTDDGHSLLFAVDSSGVLHVVREESGKTRAGWEVIDISTSTITTSFAGKGDAIVRTFDAGQSALDGTISLAMAISCDGSDHLFVSLGNSSTDTSWVSQPSWTAYEFDAPNEGKLPIKIAGILFAESNNKQYLVVDIDRLNSSAVKDIDRYYVSDSATGGSRWVQKGMPIDVQDISYQSFVGRINDSVDGVYTSGIVDVGDAQLVFMPIENPFGHGPASPTRLRLPGGALPSAIAAARNLDINDNWYGTTDLYAISGKNLYRFPADMQSLGTLGTLMDTNDVYAGTDTLLAMTHDGITTLWGKNSSDQVYYTSCPTTRLDLSAAWSHPLPILTGIERISTYVNKRDGGNTIFASGGGKLQKIMQATSTPAKLWRAQNITLPPSSPQQQAISFKSYTTTIHIADENDLPARGANLIITTKSRAPVYINGIYYVLGQTPVTVPSDRMGIVTIIEATDNIVATTLKVVTDDGTTTEINPMDKSFQKLSDLNTVPALQGANIPSTTVAGGILGQRQSVPLVGSTPSADEVAAVASYLGNLKTIYSGVNSPGTNSKIATMHSRLRVVPKTQSLASRGFWNDIVHDIIHTVDTVVDGVEDAVHDVVHDVVETVDTVVDTVGNVVHDVVETVDTVVNTVGDVVHDVVQTVDVAAGDIFNFLNEVAGHVVQLVYDAANDIWHAVVHVINTVVDTITNTVTNVIHTVENVFHTVYHAVLDTVDAVVGAVEWVFDKIKVGIEQVIQYAEMLFEWDDIRRTKDVMHNLMMLYMHDKIDNLDTARELFDQKIQDVEKTVSQWAGVTDWSPLGDKVQKPASGSASNPAKNHTSGSMLFANHFKNHVTDITIQGSEPVVNAVESLIGDLLTALKNEGAVLESVFNQLRNLATDFDSLSIVDILKRLVGILVDGVLSSVQVVVDALLQILHDLASSAIDLLDAKLHIPIISDILNLIGIPDISFLDLITWIAAVGYTVVYKIVEDEAPFPENANIQAMIDAKDWDTAKALFVSPVPKSRSSLMQSRSIIDDTIDDIPAQARHIIYKAGHGITALAAFVGLVVNPFEADAETGDNPWSKPSAALGFVGAAAGGLADFLSSKCPVKNEAVSIISEITTAIVIISKVLFSGPVQNKLGSSSTIISSLAVSDGRAVGSFVNSVLVIPALSVSAWHFYELAITPDSLERDAAIFGETSNLASYIQRISYTVAVNDPDEVTKQIPIVVMDVAGVIVAGLQTSEAALF